MPQVHGNPDGSLSYREESEERGVTWSKVTPDDLWHMATTRYPRCSKVLVAPCYPAQVAARWARDDRLKVVGDWDESTFVYFPPIHQGGGGVWRVASKAEAAQAGWLQEREHPAGKKRGGA